MDSHIIKYTDWALKNGLFYPKSSNNDILLTLAFEKVEDFCNGVAFVSNGNKWGCIDSKGSIIIPLEYDIIKFDEYDYKRFHILCGYEGELFKGIATSDWLRVTEEKEIYTGIYDLYNLNGNFLFGGFSEYKYDNKTNTFMFIFGRTWRLYKKQSKYSFDKNKYWYNDYKTKWLLLTKDFLCPFDSSFENNQIMISKKSFKGEKASYNLKSADIFSSV